MPWGFCLVSSEVELLWQTIRGIKVFDTTVPFCVRTENQSKEASNADALLTLVTVLHLDLDLSCDLMEYLRNIPVCPMASLLRGQGYASLPTSRLVPTLYMADLFILFPIIKL